MALPSRTRPSPSRARRTVRAAGRARAAGRNAPPESRTRTRVAASRPLGVHGLLVLFGRQP